MTTPFPGIGRLEPALLFLAERAGPDEYRTADATEAAAADADTSGDGVKAGPGDSAGDTLDALDAAEYTDGDDLTGFFSSAKTSSKMSVSSASSRFFSFF